jgi:hypothetical protein
VIGTLAVAAFVLAPLAWAQERRSGTYFESFEDPLGDALTIDGPGGLASQPCPAGASQSAPDCVRASRAVIQGPVCASDEPYVTSLTGVKDHNDWHVHTAATPDLSDTGKAFQGANSIHWGRHVVIGTQGNRTARADTYGLETINALLGPDLNLAPRKGSTMSFWQISEFCDEACWQFEPDTGDDYGIVEVRVDQDSSPDLTAWSPWMRVEAAHIPYDGMQDTVYSSPTFEPGDDTNPSLPSDPMNTMCLPNIVFLSQGSSLGTNASCVNADGAYDAVNGDPVCGHGALEDDPALRTPEYVSRGETGVGVWVQSKVDLGQFAGRHIQYRFIATTLDDSLDIYISYAENYGGGPPAIPADASWDDGWYIDAITVTNTVAQESRRRGSR